MITNKETLYGKVKNDLQQYIEKEAFKGYDPYDTLNSWIPFGWLGKWGKPIGIQIQKRNPINIRSFIGIKKAYNPKAIGLLLHSYSLMYQNSPSEEIKSQLDFFFNWLKENRTEGFKNYCWGYNFDWASSVKFLPAYSPTIVVSGFIAKGIIAYYEATQDKEAIEVLLSIGDFILEDLPLSEDKSGICFSYSTIEKDCCYNASMLGSELFAALYRFTKEERYKELAIRSTNFVLAKQNVDGMWNYNINLKDGSERKQIDFHQGYVLDSLANVIKYIPTVPENYSESLKKGLAYYFENQFTKDGRSYYRIPSEWPVEIHNQAQGIITFARMKKLNKEYLSQSQKIADYSILEMRSSHGWFYYKKYPWITIKTSFMRWSQAWMFLALNELTDAMQENNNV
jgi:rhamnogalacturonyl hydrolase YesR